MDVLDVLWFVLLTVVLFLKETPPPSPELMGNVAGESDSFEQSISKFNLQFTAVLVGLLDKISELGRENNNEKVLNILYR